jgi:hypothetical protein
MVYEIAIPSYKRPDTLRDKTLVTLARYGVDPSKITVFVADAEQEQQYLNALTPGTYSKIVIGEVGMGAIRRFIQRYYPEGTYVMNFDDDLSDIMLKESDKKMIPITNIETDVIHRGFKACEDNDAYLFGVYAAANAMFMKHRIAVGLYYCIGSCWGMITRHDQELSVTMDDKEDFERTLQHYVRDGKICRLDDITVKSKYYTEDGGMQVTRTLDRIHESAKVLAERYPELCSMYIRETTGHAELRLKDTRKFKTDSSSSTLDSFF